MGILYFCIIGLVAGWLAALLTKGSGFGLMGNLLVGLVGSIIGGYLFQMLGVTADGAFGSLITATIGAAALLTVIRVIKKA